MSPVSFDYLVLGGFFSLPDMKCKNCLPSAFPGGLMYSFFVNCVQCFELRQHATSPTRTGTERTNRLDLLFSNTRTPISSVAVFRSICDHIVVVGNLKCSLKKITNIRPRKVYLYSWGDYPSIAEEVFRYFAEYVALSCCHDIHIIKKLFYYNIITWIYVGIV